ncbi:MAG: hypothetical protein H9W81_12405 [Enterococcus sp.]|nr:hypothetical protein [Enterococcus sp.]
MCNPLPGSRCTNNGKKNLATAIARAESVVEHAEKLSDSIRISKNKDDIEFNAERYENVAKSIESAMGNINERKIYYYASTEPTQAQVRELSESTKGFDTYEKSFLKSEQDLVSTAKYLKKYQKLADDAHKANNKSDNPVSREVLAKSLNEKTFTKLRKEFKAKIDADFQVKAKMAKTPEEKAEVKARHTRQLESLEWANKLASKDASKVYEKPKDED